MDEKSVTSQASSAVSRSKEHMTQQNNAQCNSHCQLQIDHLCVITLVQSPFQTKQLPQTTGGSQQNKC